MDSMDSMDRTVLVAGATGQQGGAVAHRLIADGWSVRALTRDPEQPRARALKERGAEVLRGDLADRATLDRAVDGTYGVFSVQVPSEDEVLQGTTIADAAQAAGVRHLVYASASNVDQPTGLDLLKRKWEIEQHVRSIGLSATFLRPASFMENYLNPVFGLRDGALTTALVPEVRQPLIALADIAEFAVRAFEDPGRYNGVALELAGDELRPGEIADAIGRATGTTVPYVQLPLERLAEVSEDFARGYAYMNKASGKARALIPALRALHPDLLTFEAWLRNGGAERLAPLLPTAKP